jgi:hypothetical protein
VKPASLSRINEGISERQTYELAMNSKNKNITDLYREIDKLKMRNQSGSKLVSDKNGVLFADPKRF